MSMTVTQHDRINNYLGRKVIDLSVEKIEEEFNEKFDYEIEDNIYHEPIGYLYIDSDTIVYIKPFNDKTYELRHKGHTVYLIELENLITQLKYIL